MLRQTPSSSDGTGPRAKCDQVIYEAIAKAAEIIVRSRCKIPKSGNVSSRGTSRFNLEIEEVEQVRNILQRWSRSLHVPLRLDVYFEYEDPSQPQPRRELLERWCIDYAPSHSYVSVDATDTIVHLRQVCKRVVIWLRSLHSLARLMPAQSLVRRLLASDGNAGYYGYGMHQQQLHQQPPRGTIGFSFYVEESDGTNLANFGQHELNSIPTAYGNLQLRVLYDAKLQVQRLLSAATPRAFPIPCNTTNPTKMEQQAASPIMPFPQSLPSTTGAAYVAPLPMPQYSSYQARSPLHNMSSPSIRPKAAVTSVEGHEIEGQKRVLSGLSLALLNEESNDQHRPTASGRNETKATEPSPEDAALRRQRLALHHPPPTRAADPLQTTSPRGPTGDYGYGYNNMHVKEQQTTRTTSPQKDAAGGFEVSTTPSPLLGASPSPQPMFIGSAPPFPSPGGLLPPAAWTEAAVPPFSMNPVTLQQADAIAAAQLPSDPTNDDELLPPLTSMDLLHMSPFQQVASGGQAASLLSSMSAFNEDRSSMMLNSTMSRNSTALRLSAAAAKVDQAETTILEMPFAVVEEDKQQQASSVTSWAHKCATERPLQLFAGASADQTEETEELATQLAELRTFGASLTASQISLHGDGAGGAGGGGVSLKT